VEKLIQGETLIWHGRPSWRSEISFYCRWAAIGLLPLVVIIVAREISSADWSIPLGTGIFVVVLGLAVLIGFLRRYFTQYTITNRRISIRRGVLSKNEQTAHLERLQNVTIHQSLFDRMFRVGMVDFDTAGGDSDANLRFWGIDDPHGLRDRIATEYLGGDDRAPAAAPASDGV
jgi:putative membrane protein